jgi:hypothetical protein
MDRQALAAIRDRQAIRVADPAAIPVTLAAAVIAETGIVLRPVGSEIYQDGAGELYYASRMRGLARGIAFDSTVSDLSAVLRMLNAAVEVLSEINQTTAAILEIDGADTD